MTLPSHSHPGSRSLLDATVLVPLAALGRGMLGVTGYLGGVATLGIAAARAVVRPPEDADPLGAAVMGQAASILAMGVPLVALVHVGLGSFLAMQAYFGGTFVDGTGAVVGVGLIRNIAPLMTGMTLAGLLAARTTPELSARREASAPAGEPGPRVDDSAAPAPPARSAEDARLAAVRIAAAALAGLVLTSWAVVVGTLVGWQVAQTLLGISTDVFFFMFFSMLWVRDVLGLIVKGTAFALFAALFACHEGLRPAAGGQKVATAACRAACLAAVAILLVNSGWFLLLYHAGPAFGPTLLAPPSQ